jgi:hypothetical protein
MVERRQILDANGGVVKEFLYDETADQSYIVTSQDNEPIIEANKAASGDGYWRERTAKHYAEVPFSIIHKWCQEDGIQPVRYMRMDKREKEAFVRRKLGNSDYAHFRMFWERPANRIALSQPLIGD